MPIVLKSGSLNLLVPSGPVKACNRIALPLYIYIYLRLNVESLCCTVSGVYITRLLYTEGHNCRASVISPVRVRKHQMTLMFTDHSRISAPSMDLASFHLSDAWNVKVAPRFLENSCIPAIHCKYYIWESTIYFTNL